MSASVGGTSQTAFTGAYMSNCEPLTEGVEGEVLKDEDLESRLCEIKNGSRE